MAKRDGAQTINGFEMLIVQGLHSLSLWFPDRTEQAFSLQGSIIEFARKDITRKGKGFEPHLR
jgi:shikimate 5-dehydrogenase